MTYEMLTLTCIDFYSEEKSMYVKRRKKRKQVVAREVRARARVRKREEEKNLFGQSTNAKNEK